MYAFVFVYFFGQFKLVWFITELIGVLGEIDRLWLQDSESEFDDLDADPNFEVYS